MSLIKSKDIKLDTASGQLTTYQDATLLTVLADEIIRQKLLLKSYSTDETAQQPKEGYESRFEFTKKKLADLKTIRDILSKK